MVENIARNIGYAFFCLGGIALVKTSYHSRNGIRT